MGAIRSIANTEVAISADNFPDLNYVAASVCGWQPSMEDYTGYARINNKVSVFFVIDGHGGPDLAAMVVDEIPEILSSSEAVRQEQYKSALEQLCETLDLELKKQVKRASLIRQQNGLPPSVGSFPSSGCSLVVVLVGEN